MSHRYRFLGVCEASGQWRLTADESYHLAKVLRLAPGTEVEVTDGRGQWGVGTVGVVEARGTVVDVAETRREAGPERLFQFAVGALKPGAVDEILPALTELGVDVVHVYQQQDGAKARLADKAVERWGRILSQAVKQCKRAWAPELRVHGSLGGMLAALGSGGGEQLVVLAPGAERSLLATLPGEAAGLVVVAGGEKGLTDSEAAALRAAGFTEASLGPHVLRAVTAAVAAAAVVAAWRDRLASCEPAC